jgi:hypothetical protein
MSGKPAKLILAARWLDVGGVHIPLHHLRLGGLGESNAGAATALAFVPYVGVLGLAVTGGDLNYDAGQRAWALTLVDTVVSPLPDPPHVPATSPSTGPSL